MSNNVNPISLNGVWRLFWRNSSQEKSSLIPDFTRLESIPAQVPGNVELDLMRAGRLPDIFFGDNIGSVKPWEHSQWYYQRSFEVSAELVDSGVDLVFAGLDCIADIWINREWIGSCENMFIEHRFDLRNKVKAGQNELTVHIKSATIMGRKHIHDAFEWALPVNWESLSIRKAPHMYGWDIMPRLVSAGIWRDVYLEPHKKDKIVNTYYFTSRIAENEAELTLQWQFQTDHFDLSSFSLQLTGICGESCFQRTIQPESTAGQTCLKINKPLLWWPKGYGEANLYQITLELWRNNQRLDQRTEKIGLRRIQLVNTQTTTEEQPGNFYFICNDHKIMIKGANHVPIDALHSRDQKNLLHTMELYNDLGCNMIRCWGGNVYEDHAFFDFCDDHGIMVWQDFALACAFYPQADDFQSQMEKEAGAIIRKLRNHPSLVLWAGDNEIDMFLYWHNIDPARNRLSRETLPRAVARCDPHRSFLPSSPYLGPELIKQGDMALSPEQHLWGARNFYKKPFYSQTRACFASEIGWHGCPNISSLRKFLSEDKLWPWQDNSQWMTHATNPAPQSSEYQYRVKLMVHQINELFGFVPDNLKDFVRASQISQAEAMKYFIELFRTQKWDKSGIIWWNLKDGWPQFSEAAVDYYFSKKLVYYYIKRVQYPVCLMMQDPVNGLSAVIAANDTLEYVKGSYIVWIAENRKTVVSGSFDITPNVNKKLASIEIGESTPQMYIIEYEMEGKKFGNHYVAGNAPIDFQKYSQEWLKIICALPDGLNYENIGQ